MEDYPKGYNYLSVGTVVRRVRVPHNLDGVSPVACLAGVGQYRGDPLYFIQDASSLRFSSNDFFNKNSI